MLEYFTAALHEGDTSTHGDYELRYRTRYEGGARSDHVIEAFYPDAERAVAKMSWSGRNHEIQSVDVDPAHRRKGLASAMWNWAQDNARPKPKHSPDRTDDGDAWARSVGGRLPRRTSRRAPGEGLFPTEMGNTMSTGIHEYFGGSDGGPAAERRVAGRGKPRRDGGGQRPAAPGAGGGGAPAGGGRPEAGPGEGDVGQARPVTFHPGVEKDLRGLDKPVQKQIKGVIESLATGDPNLQTHALTQKLSGWYATKASRGHRIVHRNADDGSLHVGYVGLHDYDKAIRRLTSLENTVRQVPPEEYSRFHYPDYPGKSTLPALIKHFKTTEPDRFNEIRDDVQRNGFTTPILVKWNDPRGKPLKKPHVMEGHHRAAVAYDLGLHLPVGDYDNDADFEQSNRGNREWFGKRASLKRQEDLDPHQRAVHEAQEAVRREYPNLTMPVTEESGTEHLRSLLAQHGFPRADEAFVHIHPGVRSFSSTAMDNSTGAMGVALHPSRADYGTLTHEAAHLLHDHTTGRRFREDSSDEHVHGIGYAQQYARLLDPWGKKTPGGNYRSGPGDLLLNTYYDSLSRRTAAGHEKLFRGLHFGTAPTEDVDRMHKDPIGYLKGQGFGDKGAGIHWTDSPDSAYNFALDHDPEGWAHEWSEDDEEGEHNHGMILHGRVEPHHIIDPDSDEGRDYAAFNTIFDHDHPEQERTVRDQAPVHITHVTAVSSDPETGDLRETTVPWGHHVTAARDDDLQPLPDRLYHVTTAVTPALEEGLKTRSELGQQYGHGLGGGRDDTISLTTHRPTAEHLLHSLHEYHDVLNGKITPDDLVEKARRGIGAKEPYEDMLRGGNRYYERAKDLEGSHTIERGIHALGEQPDGWEPQGESQGEHHQTGQPIYLHWKRPVDPKERIRARSDLYKHFTFARQFAKGHMDPLFIQNDPVEFAKKDPGEFSLLEVRPKPGARGIRMNDRTRGTDAGEWRALSGKDLDIVYNESRDQIEPRVASTAERIGEEHYDEGSDEYKHLWDEWHPKLQSEIHRHLAMDFPHDHPIFDTRASDAEKAHAILDQAAKGYQRAGHVGWHWTDDPNLKFLQSGGRLGYGQHPIVLHAKTPPREHIEDNYWTLIDDRAVKDWDDHPEREVPVKRNAPVHITGVSWPVGGGEMRRHDFDQPIVKRAGRGCSCCGGMGEHGAIECYACDGSGAQEGPEVGTRCQRRCPCRLMAEYDPQDGWQHLDGSVSHDDPEGSSVSDLMKFAGAQGGLPEGLHFKIHEATGDRRYHKIDAHVPGRKEPIGSMMWDAIGDEDDPDTLPGEVFGLRVEPEYRRRGIANAMWDHATANVSPAPEHSPVQTEEGAAWARQTTAAHPMPTSRVFGPTYGLDHRLFEGEHLRPEVRTAVMARLGPVLEPLLGQDWQRYTRVYLAGSEASEWTSETLEGNSDFDTLIGIDYDQLQGEPGVPLAGEDDLDIATTVNRALRENYDAEPWKAPFGGEWSLTGYVNANSYDITRIKPYAAYDITDDTWAVKPPHLPDWSIDKLPEGGQNLLDEAEGYAKVIEAIERMPEPFQTQQGKALWHHLHSDRGRAFSDEGEGWLDPGNLIEKALVEWGLWDKLVEWQYGKKTASLEGVPVEHVRVDKLWPYREWDHQPGGHSYDREGGGPYAGKHDAQSWERNRQSVAEGGIEHPITLEYNPKTHSAYIGEGNHRLHWARELGHQTVPVRVWRTSKEMESRYALPGAHWLPEGEHIPQELDPKAVLPQDWFPGQGKTAGARGDLPELTFKHLSPKDNHPYGGADQDTHTLHAYTADGRHAGELSWFGEDGMIRDVNVHDALRRRGIASELLRRARQIQPGVHHSDALTSDGAGWARKVSVLEYFTASAELEMRTRKGKRKGISHTMITAYSGDRKAGHVRMTEGDTEVDDLHVVPAMRGQGVARALMNEVVDRFGHQPLRLHASPFGPGGLDKEALQAFYASHGFEPEEDRGPDYMVRRPGKTAVKRSDHPLAPDLPEEQHDALDTEDYTEHKRKMLDLAKNPVPGTHIWRGELRTGDPVKSARETGVGIHWGVNPDTIVRPQAFEGEHEVVYHAEIEHPGEQNFSRSHPMWRGRHMSMDSEAEVRLKPGTRVKLHGVWYNDPYVSDKGYFTPTKPERMGKQWSYTPINEYVQVAHRPSNGLIDYGDVGVKHEGVLEYFTADYRLMHRAPDENSGKPLHHFEGGDPDDLVRIYRAAPHGVDYFDNDTWATQDPDYAHQHAEQYDGGKKWPVMSAEVPKKHVFWDENDPHEVGYQGPRLESHQIELHDQETGEHYPYEPPSEEEQKELDRGGNFYHGMGVHLSPEDHAFVHDESKPIAERAHRVFQHVPERIRQNGTPHWEEDPDEAEMDTYDEDRHVGRGEHNTPLTRVVVHGSQNLDHAHGISWADDDDPSRSMSFQNYHHHEFEDDPNQRINKSGSLIDYFGMAA